MGFMPCSKTQGEEFLPLTNCYVAMEKSARWTEVELLAMVAMLEDSRKETEWRSGGLP
jgi:hypothetical protein